MGKDGIPFQPSVENFSSPHDPYKKLNWRYHQDTNLLVIAPSLEARQYRSKRDERPEGVTNFEDVFNISEPGKTLLYHTQYAGKSFDKTRWVLENISNLRK